MDSCLSLIKKFKESGNEKVSANKLEEAINDYSMALKLAKSASKQQKHTILIDLMSLIHSNRAQCYIQLKQYQKGIIDCNQSIALCTNNKSTNQSKLWKSYYRRAISYESLNQLNSALDDLKTANHLFSKHNSKKSIKSNHKRDKNPINSALNRIKQKLQQTAKQNVFFDKNVFTKDHAIGLINNGYVVIDNFFKWDIAKQLFSELQRMIKLKNPSYLTPNTTFFKNKSNQIMPFNKPFIWEIDLHSIFASDIEKTKAHKAEFFNFYHLFSNNDLANIIESKLLQTKNGWNLCKGNDGKYGIKLQWNEGKHGCFPFHIDNPGNNERRITLVFYMNAAWKEGDGGEIVLMPFMGQQIVIAPLFNRCVIFLSECMLHRVMPSSQVRYCFSVWIDKDGVNGKNIDELLFEKDDDEKNEVKLGNVVIDKEMQWLKKPSVQCALSRWVYEEEYVQSLKECMIDHKESDVYKELYAMHRQHIDGLKEANKETGLIEIVEWLKKNKPKNDECIKWDNM